MSDGMLFATLQPNLNTLELEKFSAWENLDMRRSAGGLRLSGSVGTGSDSH